MHADLTHRTVPPLPEASVAMATAACALLPCRCASLLPPSVARQCPRPCQRSRLAVVAYPGAVPRPSCTIDISTRSLCLARCGHLPGSLRARRQLMAPWITPASCSTKLYGGGFCNSVSISNLRGGLQQQPRSFSTPQPRPFPGSIVSLGSTQGLLMHFTVAVSSRPRGRPQKQQSPMPKCHAFVLKGHFTVGAKARRTWEREVGAA
ncbi:hypothetical protein BRADI_5g14836v3 [Brachypodium distachyon]|uniref:Uncharacterized protein n=1 Tax=Brachypodium distachyon TaxID=15368 RepID=A0A2K2CHA3_BRADI|nr:hypothetical protein BRADI_5g14836v3 [Brachypodium distachyon]